MAAVVCRASRALPCSYTRLVARGVGLPLPMRGVLSTATRPAAAAVASMPLRRVNGCGAAACAAAFSSHRRAPARSLRGNIGELRDHLPPGRCRWPHDKSHVGLGWLWGGCATSWCTHSPQPYQRGLWEKRITLGLSPAPLDIHTSMWTRSLTTKGCTASVRRCHGP